MKAITGIAAIAFVGAIGWRMGDSLSTDALGMAVGMLFGVLAGIPTALILLASQRREEDLRQRKEEQPQRLQIAQQPPAHIVNHYYYHAPTVLQNAPQRHRRAEVEARHQLTGPASEVPAPRQFRIIGATESTRHKPASQNTCAKI